VRISIRSNDPGHQNHVYARANGRLADEMVL
jgi:hypothetical protein